MFVNPENTISHLELKTGITAADFGCGAGFYTIPLAKAVGADGKVYAFDIRKEMLEIIKSKARLENLLNVETIWADLEINGSTKLRDEAADAVIISNLLFQVENKRALAKEAVRILKKGGRLLVVEWGEGAGIGGPLPTQRVRREEVKRIFEEEKLIFAEEFNAGDRHYGLLFRKS